MHGKWPVRAHLVGHGRYLAPVAVGRERAAVVPGEDVGAGWYRVHTELVRTAKLTERLKVPPARQACGERAARQHHGLVGRQESACLRIVEGVPGHSAVRHPCRVASLFGSLGHSLGQPPHQAPVGGASL